MMQISGEHFHNIVVGFSIESGIFFMWNCIFINIYLETVNTHTQTKPMLSVCSHYQINGILRVERA